MKDSNTKNQSPAPSSKSKTRPSEEVSDLKELLEEKETQLAACNKKLEHALKGAENAQELSLSLGEMENELSEMRALVKESEAHKNEASDLQDVLMEKEQELNAVKEQLGRLEKETGELDALESKLQASEKNLKKVSSARKEQEAHIDRLEKEINELKASHDREQKNAQSTAKSLKASERKLKKARGDIKALKDQLAALEKEKAEREAASEHAEEREPAVPAAKSTFRIDLYPGQDQYQGRIVHLLSSDKKAFTERNTKPLIDFIASHRPQLEEAANGPVAEKTDAASRHPAHATTAHTAPQNGDSFSLTAPSPFSGSLLESMRVPHVDTFSIVPEDTHRPSITIRQNRPFTAKLAFDMKNVEDFPTDEFSYEVVIYVRTLGQNGRYTLAGKEKDTVQYSNQLITEIGGISLLAGTYKLLLIAVFNTSNGAPKSIGAIHRSSLIHVV